MCSLLQGLDPQKPPGPDGISPSLLKCFAALLAPSLAEIFNKSLSTGLVPSAFKRANVTPILKDAKGGIGLPGNYRGISLTPILSKVLERIVVQQLNDQFSGVRQPLSDTQYGFRRHRSTMLLLVHAVNDWLIAKDVGKTTAVVYIDLSKAFDKVCHQIHCLETGTLRYKKTTPYAGCSCPEIFLSRLISELSGIVKRK